MRPDRAGGLLSVGLLAGWCAPAAAPVAPPLARVFDIPLRRADDRGVSLTFDDGPDRHGTPAVLELLERAGVRATFFLVGEQVDAAPALAAEIAAAGHEVAIHGYRHRLLLRRTPAAVRDDFARAADVIGAASGGASRYYRPPYGVFSTASLRIARERWQPVLWSRWGRDWQARATGASISRRVTRSLGAGEILLLHDSDRYSSRDSWRRTVAALPAVLDALRATGEPIATLSGPG